MNRKYVYYIFGFTFLSFCLLILFFSIGNKAEPQDIQDVQVTNSPFLTYISGSGIVEPASGNIMITSPFNNRVVEKIKVCVNDQVKKGEILFQLYNQDLVADLDIKQKKYEESLSNVYRLKESPRAEELAIAQATLNKAQSLFDEAITEYCYVNRCAKSRREKCMGFYKYQQAEADYLIEQAQFRKIQSGTWQPDVKIAQFQVEQAKAAIEAIKKEIERTYIKSPIDGTILQIKIHEGEILDQNKTALILGNIDALNLRVGVDQFNEPRFHADCPAIAFKQGNTSTEFQLKFLHIEPFMVPKKYLTNELHEKVDTQIFEILYRIEKNNSHLFIGEQMDVYIYVGDCAHAKSESS